MKKRQTAILLQNTSCKNNLVVYNFPMLSYINQDTLFLLVVFLSVMVIGLVIYAIRNEFRFKRLLKGNHISDLEKFLLQIEAHLKKIDSFGERADKTMRELDERVRNGARAIGMVRFNPFGKKDGGNQSFAVAFMNEKKDGVVFSGLHVQDRMTMFSKSIKDGESSQKLSTEEKKAIQQAYE